MEGKDKLHARQLRDKTTISNVNGSVQTVIDTWNKLPDTWNKLPDTAINATNIHDFKDRLTHDLFNQYNK